MYNFCTLFDSNYLSRGIACYRSLKKHCGEFHLYIFAFDDKSYSVLMKMSLPDVTVIPLNQFEDPELLKVKPSRTIAEYCWTSTSSTILYVLENYKVDNCTYIDADIFFYASPKILFDEMGDKSILITEHRYSPQYNKELKAGKYCVQFVTFKKDERGLKALRWWRDRCIEWCYNRFEDGKFGDQLYLDDWTTRFEGVNVLQHNGGGIAAWNVQQYDFKRAEEKIIGVQNDGKEFEVIFYHFHYLRFYKDDSVELGRRILSEKVKNIFYKPYIQYLDSVKAEIIKIDNSFDSNGPSASPLNWKTPLLFVYRKLLGTYNIYNKQKFLGN